MSRAEADALQHEAVAFYLASHPTHATYLGVGRDVGGFRSFAPGALERERATWRSLLKRWERIDPERLAGDARLDHEALGVLIDTELAYLEDWRPFERDPGVYAREVLEGVTFGATRGSLAEAARLAGLRSRLAAIEGLVDEALALLREVPSLWARLALEELAGAEDYFRDLAEARLRRLRLGHRQRERKASQPALASARRALARFREYLVPLAAAETDRLGVGELVFRRQLWATHRWRLDPEELRRIGSEGLETTRRELAELASSAGFAGDWKRMLAVQEEAAPRSSTLLGAYRRAVARARRHVETTGIVPLPSPDTLEVLATPEFERATISFSAYWDPEMLTGRGHGSLMVTVPRGSPASVTRSLRGHHSYGAIDSTAVHEGYPGHQLQSGWTTSLGSDIRRLLIVPSHAEGWALYAETLMADSAFFTPAGQARHLADRLLRAARVLIDVWLQVDGRPVEACAAFLTSEVGLDEEAALAEVSWYSREPTTPLAYFAGMREILALRHDLEHRLGSRFSLVEFHRRFLECGSLPIPLIAAHLQRSWH